MTENFSLRTFFNKRTLFFLLLINLLAFLFFACRPEIVTNDKLNGDWSLQSINNKPIAKGDYETLHFEKNASGGDIVLTMHLEGKDTTCSGKYDVLKNSTLTFAFPTHKSTGYMYQTEVFEIVELSGTNMSLRSLKSQNQLEFLKK
ncbi:MAG: hypothetical protein EB100_08845 [Crocinitomicaceae bacterium]|nr:hypothetical protein [Crocinitomicaceae bacterium]